MQTYEVLEKALAEVERGWCRGELEDDRGNVCARGALHRVLDAEMHFCGLGAEGQAALAALRARCGGNIGVFNDSHTHAEVVALFQKAISQEKAKAGIYVELPKETEARV